jgi:ADP-ribose pyrophosphatase YjhB (NUDIX family)
MIRHVLLRRNTTAEASGSFVDRTIHAVGGIAVRKGARPRVAVVQRSKDKLWVLPRGKLRRDEHPVRGARREVVEETGFRVEVREFLGVITYQARGRPKVVRFWLMRAEAEPSYQVMKDIVAVDMTCGRSGQRHCRFSPLQHGGASRGADQPRWPLQAAIPRGCRRANST